MPPSAPSAWPLAGANGRLTLNADGSYTYEPAASTQALDVGDTVQDIFTYTIGDGNGGTASTTLTITVTGTNDAPVAVADVGSTPEDTPVSGNVLTNDGDVDVEPLTVTGFSVAGIATPFTAGQAANIAGVGTLVINATGSYTFTPAADYTGPVPVATYTVSDGTASATATLTLNVTPVNDNPVANADVGSVTEDATLDVSAANGVIQSGANLPAADSDVDGDALTVTAVSFGAANGVVGVALNGANGALTLNADGSYRYEPASSTQALDDGESVQDVFTYIVSDGNGGTATTTLTITVTGTNDAPVAVADVGTTPEDTPVSGNVLTNDSDVDGESFTVTGFSIAGIATPFTAGQTATIAGVGTLVINATGAYTFTPAANYTGPVPVATYTVSDGTASTTATLTLNVTPVNDPPVANNDTASTPINTAVVIDVKANDTDPDNAPAQLVVSNPVLSSPAQGSVVVNPDGTLTFTPALNVTGPVTITYTLTDPSGLSDTATVTVNVGANTPPAGADATRTIAEDTPYTIAASDLGFSDADLGQTLSGVRIVTTPTNGTLQLNGVAVAPNQLIPLAALNAGQLRFVPDANENGTPYGSFTFSVQDSAGGADPTPNTFAFNVTPVNDNPAANPDAGSTTEDAPLVVNAANGVILSGASVPGRDSDVDGDSLTVTGVSFGPTVGTVGGSLNGANGALTLRADGSYTYTPATSTQALDLGESVQDVFTYTVSDGNGGTATTTLTVTVTGTNDAPTAVADVGTTPEDTPVSGNVLANDSDVDVEAFTVTGFSVAGIATPFTAGQTATIAGVGTPGDRRQRRLHLHPGRQLQRSGAGGHLHRLRRHRLVHRHAHPERDPGERPAGGQ